MIRRVWTAYTIELAKALRAKFTYLGPLILVLAVLVTALIKNEETSLGGYAFVAYATTATLNLPGLLMLITYCGALVAPEVASGQARMLLVRPLYRHEYLAGKFLLGVTYAAGLSAAVAVTSWTIPFVRGELQGVSFGGEILYTHTEMQSAYLAAMALSLLPQAAAVAFSLMMSTATRNAAAAITAAIGVWVALDSVKYRLGVERFVFTTYWETPWDVFRNRCDAIDAGWTPELYWVAGVSLSACVCFALVAGFLFRNRNLHT